MDRSVKFWDNKAEKYARSPIADETSYQRKIKQTQQYLSKEMQLLEFGCGTGSTAILHAPLVAKIDALDTSSKMIEIGQQRAAEAGIDNIQFSATSLDEFNAASSSKDAVLGLNVIHLISDRQSVFHEVYRILKTDGIFISSTACLGRSYLRFIKLLSPIGKLLGLMPDVFVMSQGQLIKEIKDAGFEIEVEWSHGVDEISVFIIARKTKIEPV